MKTNEIVKAIREQQIECSKYVYIKILTEEEIEKLLGEGNYFYTEKDCELLVAFYVKLLSEKHKIYRIGGFTVSNIENPIFSTKIEVIKLIAKLKQYVFKHNINFIAETNTVSLKRYYISMGAKKVSFEDCLEQYPLFLKLYLNNFPKTKEFLEFFKSKTFYVREAR